MNGEDVGKALDILKNKKLGIFEVVDVEAHMDKIAELSKAVDQTDGWVELINQGGETDHVATGHTKQLEDGDTAMRVMTELDLAPQHAVEMFAQGMRGNEEMPNWYTDLKSMEVIEEFGPDDKLTRWNLKLSWALTYVMGIPETVDIRLIVRKNWPEENNYSYCTIPYDMEKKTPVEEYGPIKIESGCFMPHPDDPNKCFMNSLTKADLKYCPEFAIKMLMRKEWIQKFRAMTVLFKKSKTYAEMIKE